MSVTGFNSQLSKVVGLTLCIISNYVILLPTSSALPQLELDAVTDENSTTALPDYPDVADDNSLAQSHSNFGFGVGNLGSNGTLEDRERLIKHLLDKYNKLNYPSNITVQLGTSIFTLNIDGLPRRNTFETNSLVRKLWTDSRLEWNPANYGGLDVISLPSSTVWTPEIRLLNSVSFPSSKHCEESNVLIDSDGHVLLATPCQYIAFCNVSLEDEGSQSCELVFGAYSWGGSFMDLQVYKKQLGVDFTFFNDVTDLVVTGSRSHRLEKYFGFYSETFPVMLKFELMFHRRPHAVNSVNQNGAYSSAELSTPSGNFSSFATYSISNTAPVTACADSHRVGPDGTCVPITDFA